MHRNSIDSKQADLVRTIADKGSLTKAAEALFVTQSALSHRLRKLEEQLGIRLFDRSGGALTVTRAGRVVYDYAVKLQQERRAFDQGLGEVLRKNDYRYTHGYSAAESVRLADQAQTVADYIHHDSYWPAGSTILEVGCGVGAQTKLIADQNPDCQFIGIDRSASSIRKARLDPELNSLPNVTLEVLDVIQLSHRSIPFDHIFVCFVLEHLTNPLEILQLLYSHLPEGGTLTVVEGDHGSTYFHPASVYADRAVAAQVALQRANGGDANIGRQLYPLLNQAAFRDIVVSPRCIYVDDGKPELKQDFILKTFTSMIEGIRKAVVEEGIETKAVMDQGIADLRLTSQPGGTFNYTFFKARARK